MCRESTNTHIFLHKWKPISLSVWLLPKFMCIPVGILFLHFIKDEISRQRALHLISNNTQTCPQLAGDSCLRRGVSLSRLREGRERSVNVCVHDSHLGIPPAHHLFMPPSRRACQQPARRDRKICQCVLACTAFTTSGVPSNTQHRTPRESFL